MNRANANETPSPFAPSEGPSGIGGWLLLPILHLLMVLYFNGKGITYIALYLQWSQFTGLFDFTSPTFGIAELPLLLRIIEFVSFFCLAATTLVLLLLRSRKAPGLIFAFYVASTVWSFLELVSWLSMSTFYIIFSPLPSIGAIIAGILGSAYFRKSRRVANTFKTEELRLSKQMDTVFK